MSGFKKDFPCFAQSVGRGPLVYLDNASTTQKPQVVIDELHRFYQEYTANIHRGIHFFGEKITSEYELSRQKIAHFIGAMTHEIIFTKGTTEGINAVAQMWGIEHIKAGQTIVLSQLEHHANLVPWQYVAHVTGATLKFIPVNKQGQLNFENIDSIITEKTGFVAVTHISNALGSHVDIDYIIQKARAVGAKVLVDAAQSVPHQKIDVKAIDCDFLVFSGHKIGGPTGIGVLYIAQSLHDFMQPYQRGGNMVHSVTWDNATWAKAPHKFEAGTPPIAEAIALKAAVDYYVQNVDFNALMHHEAALCALAIKRLSALEKIVLYGPLDQLARHGHILSFNVRGIHAHDVAAYLDKHGIAVRAGHHCAQPLADILKIPGSVRASFYLYNSVDDVTYLCDSLERLCKEGLL